MKTNEAPEKIYLFENPITKAPDDRWLSIRSDDADIEYTRTDALMDKVCEWIKEHNGDYISIVPNDHLTNNFYDDLRKSMKGE